MEDVRIGGELAEFSIVDEAATIRWNRNADPPTSALPSARRPVYIDLSGGPRAQIGAPR